MPGLPHPLEPIRAWKAVQTMSQGERFYGWGWLFNRYLRGEITQEEWHAARRVYEVDWGVLARTAAMMRLRRLNGKGVTHARTASPPAPPA